MKFKTQFNAKDFTATDDEVYVPGTSETEPGQGVDVKAVYERCLRGELPDVIRSGDYAIKGDMSMDDAFATIDPTESEGFDLADVTSFAQAMAGKELSTSKQGAEPVDSSSDEAAVGNSNSDKNELE